MFNERDRERCNSCGKWVSCCSLCTPSIELDHYGDYAICEECFKKNDSHDLQYWKEWINKKRK